MSVLCEYFSKLGHVIVEQHTITESSAALSLPIVKTRPGAMAAIIAAHKDDTIKLGHDVQFEQSKSINSIPLLAIFLSKHKVGWLLLFGTNGTAVLKVRDQRVGRYKSKTLQYEALVADEQNNVQRLPTTSEKRVAINSIKSIIGNISDIYMGVQATELTAGAIKNRRADDRATSMSLSYSSPEQWSKDFFRLVNKFSPLWEKIAQKALSEIKSQIITAIKNDRTTNMRGYTERYERLVKIYDSLKNSKFDYKKNSHANIMVTNAVKRGLAMTAAYFYPEETGKIDDNGYPENNKGIYKVLKDFDAGDIKKLSTLIYFVKDAFITASYNQNTFMGLYPGSSDET